MADEPKKPLASQMMQHPNSMKARMAKDKKLRQQYKDWKRQVDADAEAAERAAKRGWVG